MSQTTLSLAQRANATDRRLTTRRREFGVSLIEVLISLFILAISGLGIANIQTRGIALLHASRLHEQAVLFAQDIAEQMAAAGGNSTGVDIAQWQHALSIVLPQGRGEVHYGAHQVEVIVRWQPHVPSSDAATCAGDASQTSTECVQWSLAL